MKGQETHETPDEPDTATVLGIIVLVLFFFSVGAFVGYQDGEESAAKRIHQDAAQHGAGSYQLDRETGEVRFVWREAVEL